MGIINTVATVAGAIVSVGAAGALLYKPIKKHREKKAAFEAKVLGGLDKLEQQLDSLTDDVSELQGDRLSQSHRYWTEQGWCPASEKAKLIGWHAKYRAKGFNHLADSYEQDILNLPETPAEKED